MSVFEILFALAALAFVGGIGGGASLLWRDWRQQRQSDRQLSASAERHFKRSEKP